MSEDEAPARRSVFSAAMHDNDESNEEQLPEAPAQTNAPDNVVVDEDEDEIL